MAIGYNVPTFTENNFSFGPGVVFMGAAGATPSVDVGLLTDDSVTFEFTNDKKFLSAGNAKQKVYAFGQSQDMKVSMSGVEWDVTRFSYALGCGTTTSTSTSDTMVFGGDPIIKKVAIQIQHQMAQPGHTLNVYLWTAVSDGGLSIKLGDDAHNFAYAWTALRSTTNWGGTALARGATLGLLERLKT